jgi:HPt (histidine-containing phosphotransfer) domain-containing protein
MTASFDPETHPSHAEKSDTTDVDSGQDGAVENKAGSSDRKVPDAAMLDKTARLIATIWARNQPLVEERLRVLEGVAAAAGEGRLSEAQRVEGQDVSHKLSGSLGMFGFPEGTEIARELEVALGGAQPDPALLGRLAGRLRAVLEQPAQAFDLLA